MQNKLNKATVIVVAMLVAASSAAFADNHQEAKPGAPSAPTYVTGGVSIEEAEELAAKRNAYSLWLVTAAKSGAHVAGAQATVLDSAGKPVLQTTLDGPYLMANLAPGRYTLRVDFEGQVQQQRINIAAKRTQKIVMRFNYNAQVSPDLRAKETPY